MALVRWEPARELDTLQGEVNRLFDTFFGNGGSGQGARRWVPAMDLVETDDSLVLTADLPGLTREDVAIEVKDRVLTVSGKRESKHQGKADGFYRVERAFGGFSRSMTLPDGVESDKVTADFDNGVLEITIPKPAEQKPHRVEIGGKPALEGSAEDRSD
jgi:HSP20 family protein